MLSNTQLQTYKDKGYLVVPSLIDHAIIDDFNEYLVAWREMSGVGVQGHQKDEKWFRMAAIPPIPEILADLMGGEAVLLQTMYFAGGSQARLHQDEFFFPCDKPSIIGAWLAMEDVEMEQGPLHVIEGSHKGRLITAADLSGRWWLEGVRDELSDRTEEIADWDRLIPLTAKKGDVIFFSGRTIHGGAKVLKRDSSRLSYVCHYHHIDTTVDPSNNKVDLTPYPLR
jgi:ectoine hydroxylase-related dioxygenase (phytanoyl-CoA dioxygenase family)